MLQRLRMLLLLHLLLLHRLLVLLLVRLLRLQRLRMLLLLHWRLLVLQGQLHDASQVMKGGRGPEFSNDFIKASLMYRYVDLVLQGRVGSFHSLESSCSSLHSRDLDLQ